MSENEKNDGEGVGQNPSKTNGDIQHSSEEEKEPKHPTIAKAVSAKDKLTEKKENAKDEANPPGGYDDTPIIPTPDGYTLRFTFHRAENLPVSDIKDRSSDPYVVATLTAPSIRKRHKDDPDMALRTKTIHKSTNPQWNQEWIVANIPSDGFRLKCRLYDEDQADHDDRLGNVTISVAGINESWPGIREESYDVKKRMGSKRAYFLKGCLSMLSREVHMNGKLVLSVEVVGESDPPHGRLYTVGPTIWVKHYSPMIGRIAGTKNPEQQNREEAKTEKYE